MSCGDPVQVLGRFMPCVPAHPARHWLQKTARVHWKPRKAGGGALSWPGVYYPAAVAVWHLNTIGEAFLRHLGSQ